MTFASVLIAPAKNQISFGIKWVASIIQIAGYTSTAFGFTPWNMYFFLAGLLGWLTVGILWNDRAIMLIHLVALCAMIIGMNSQTAPTGL